MGFGNLLGDLQEWKKAKGWSQAFTKSDLFGSVWRTKISLIKW